MKIKINPDKERADKIREEIVKNNGYCTCQVEKSENTKCLCSNFLSLPKIGWCFCHLYYKEEI